MSTMASQITGVSIVYSTICSGGDQRKHQSSTSLAFMRGIHRWPVNSPHKRPITRKMFPFDDVIMTAMTQCHKYTYRVCLLYKSRHSSNKPHDVPLPLFWHVSAPYHYWLIIIKVPSPNMATVMCKYTEADMCTHLNMYRTSNGLPRGISNKGQPNDIGFLSFTFINKLRLLWKKNRIQPHVNPCFLHI